jgi:hypothetical protein
MPEQSNTLRDRWLLVLRVAWVMVAALVVGLLVAGAPEYNHQLHTLSDPDIGDPAAVRTNLKAEPVAFLVALMLVAGEADSPTSEALAAGYPIADWLDSGLSFVSIVCLFLFFYLFPDGRFVPRWTRWLMVVGIGLTAVYLGGVTATQTIFRAITGQEQQPQLAIVASTLVIAALFNPLRRSINTFIDRRFYRSKYDAAKTLQEFSAKLRDETDLDQLNADLLLVVRGTMQPEHVSLWLKPADREVKR